MDGPVDGIQCVGGVRGRVIDGCVAQEGGWHLLARSVDGLVGLGYRYTIAVGDHGGEGDQAIVVRHDESACVECRQTLRWGLQEVSLALGLSVDRYDVAHVELGPEIDPVVGGVG